MLQTYWNFYGALGYLLPGADPDVNGDGFVDGLDFLEIQRTDPSLIPAWEAAYGAAPPVSAVPEPMSASLTATCRAA